MCDLSKFSCCVCCVFLVDFSVRQVHLVKHFICCKPQKYFFKLNFVLRNFKKVSTFCALPKIFRLKSFCYCHLNLKLLNVKNFWFTKGAKTFQIFIDLKRFFFFFPPLKIEGKTRGKKLTRTLISSHHDRTLNAFRKFFRISIWRDFYTLRFRKHFPRFNGNLSLKMWRK